MGYNTNFTGKLAFKNKVTLEELDKLKSIFGEDCRRHPEWNATNLTWMDLVVSEDETGIEWDSETEKTYDLTDKVNLVIRLMKESFPEFALEGSLKAQGEDPSDRWILKVENNVATKKDLVVIEADSVCPHCGKSIKI